MGRVIRFEIQVPHPDEAIEFYSSCFGRKIDLIRGAS